MENNTIKEIRVKYNLTRQTLADMLGVSSVTIQNWEKGLPISQTRIPSIKRVMEELDRGKSQLTISNSPNITNSPNANNTYNNEELTSALNKALEQNKKSQEQIDKLIEIISKKLT